MIIIRSHRLIGTDLTIYEAWEPTTLRTSEDEPGGHSTITFVETDDGESVCYGTLASRPLPLAISQLPGGSPERVRLAQEFMATNKAESVKAILAAHPEIDENAGNVRIAGGRVEVQG